MYGKSDNIVHDVHRISDSDENKSLKNHQTTLFLIVFSDSYFKCEQHKIATAIKISKILNI